MGLNANDYRRLNPEIIVFFWAGYKKGADSLIKEKRKYSFCSGRK